MYAIGTSVWKTVVIALPEMTALRKSILHGVYAERDFISGKGRVIPAIVGRSHIVEKYVASHAEKYGEYGGRVFQILTWEYEQLSKQREGESAFQLWQELLIWPENAPPPEIALQNFPNLPEIAKIFLHLRSSRLIYRDGR